MKCLTKKDVIEASGHEASLDTLRELEVLFLNFDEIDVGCFRECNSLTRLSLIDNGLKAMTNLPALDSLLSLTLCNQPIKEISYLEMPNLKELYLHQNLIRKLSNLNGCPRLKKLWLCQNRIDNISGLHALPELEECCLEGNAIKQLRGLESNTKLRRLALAGNPIADFGELKRALFGLSVLTELSFADIHFGRCPLVDDKGYKDFVLCYLPQVRLLDGVLISPEKRYAAEDAMLSQLSDYDRNMRLIDEEFIRDLQRISDQQKSRESHSTILEKEMSAALTELQGLVNEGRGVVAKQARRTEVLLDDNLRSLENGMRALESRTQRELQMLTAQAEQEFDLASSSLCDIERIATGDAVLVACLCDAHNDDNRSNKQPQDGQSSNNYTTATPPLAAINKSCSSIKSSSPQFSFYEVDPPSLDFQMMAHVLRVDSKDNDAIDFLIHSEEILLGSNEGEGRADSDISGQLPQSSALKTSSTRTEKRNLNKSTNEDANVRRRSRPAGSILKLAKLYRVAQQKVSSLDETLASTLSPFPISPDSPPSRPVRPPNHRHKTSVATGSRLFAVVDEDLLREILLLGFKQPRSEQTGNIVLFSNPNCAALLSTEESISFDISSFLPKATHQPFSVSSSYNQGSDVDSPSRSATLRSPEDIQSSNEKKKLGPTDMKAINDTALSFKFPLLHRSIGKRILFMLSFCVDDEFIQKLQFLRTDDAYERLPGSRRISPTSGDIQIPVNSSDRLSFMQALKALGNPDSGSTGSAQQRPLLLTATTRLAQQQRQDDDSTDGICDVVLIQRAHFHSQSPPLEHAMVCMFDSSAIAAAEDGSYDLNTGDGVGVDDLLTQARTILDVLSVPLIGGNKKARILSTFEKESGALVQAFMQRLLVEAHDSEASTMKQRDDDMMTKESLIGELREDIEKERRAQEVGLREVRAQAQQNSNSSSNNSGGASGSRNSAAGRATVGHGLSRVSTKRL